MDTSTDSICFRKNDFNLYAFLLFCIVMYLCFIIRSCRETFLELRQQPQIQQQAGANDSLDKATLLSRLNGLQEELFQCKKGKQMCEMDLQDTQNYVRSQADLRAVDKHDLHGGSHNRLQLERIYNPLVPPERTYPTGRLNAPGTSDFQQIGFIYNNNERLPLYGRPKYPGRTEKYEYYIIDETRNRLKIPYRSKNDNELYDGDTIHVDILNDTFTVKIYDYDQFRYDPRI